MGMERWRMIVRGNRIPVAWRVSLPDQWRTCTTESILELEALGDFVVSKSGSGLPVDWGVVFPPILMGVPAVWRDTRLRVTLERICGGRETYQRH